VRRLPDRSRTRETGGVVGRCAGRRRFAEGGDALGVVRVRDARLGYAAVDEALPLLHHARLGTETVGASHAAGRGGALRSGRARRIDVRTGETMRGRLAVRIDRATLEGVQ